MAQPGNFTPILLYGSSTPGNVPLAANLTNSATGSEIAINVADKNLFFKDSGGVVNTVPIRQSSTSSNGWLSSTDWNTFNNKSNTNGTVTSVAALTLGTTGTDLSSTVANSTTTPLITLNVPTASAANRGALSAADWSTFNGKQAALVSGTNLKTVGGLTLLGSGDVGTIGVGYGGTGLTAVTAGHIPFGSSATALTTSANLFWDNANAFLGIGTNSPQGKLHVSGGFAGFQYNSAGAYPAYNTYFGAIGTNFSNGGAELDIWNTIGTGFVFRKQTAASTQVALMQLHTSGGVSIGNTTDPGAGGLKVSGAISAVIAYQASLALGAAWNPTIPTIGVSQLWQFTFVSVTPAIPRIVTGMLSSDSAGAVTWHGILTELGMYVDTSGTLRFINNTATVINVYLTGTRLL